MSSTSVAGKARPQIRNIHVTQILQYKLPPPGMVSILHRVSGAVLFLTLPLILWLFDLSLMSELSFARLADIASHWFVKLVLLLLVWAFLHHLIAGIRYLLLDMHLGVERAAARTSALVVFWISLPLTALVALKLFGVF
ncbi:MAG TPA: succinate dehydrogenase, cytochrome b556 subunit [Burkholderiaceae bacterium]|nr:succinate dehydrogenase, cytochrome b556 subunit [Burkholderiaceae bacterium]HQR77616.1 succinate dehydrogenase, cytochrome b556 subunit [Burkholderiaceae bacterium]